VLGIALLHVACVVIGAQAYRYFGAGEQMAARAAAGSPVPALITLLLAACFTAMGIYLLSGAGLVRPLPLVRELVLATCVIFSLRGLRLAAEVFVILRRPGVLPPRTLLFSAVALVVGVLGLIGIVTRWTALRPRAGIQ
jgi:hypothetical protein